MQPVVRALRAGVVSLFRSRGSLQLEILAVQHPGPMSRRSSRRRHVQPSDRMLRSWLSRGGARWRAGLGFVHPASGLAWQRPRVRELWARLSPSRRPGRPAIPRELREIATANPRWGAPRILGDLRKLGRVRANSPVEQYRMRPHLYEFTLYYDI